MRKFFQILGIATIICVSFIYTEKSVSVVEELDSIMINIKQEANKYQTKPVDAIIKDNTIIPGIYGSKVNENKSYYQMKKYGKYTPNLLVYENIKPSISVKNKYDKYIVSGNYKLNNVGLIFIVKENDNINNILSILDEKNVKATFFVDGYWLEKNNDKINELAIKGHNIGSSGYNYNYDNKSNGWINTVIKNVSKAKNSYCLVNEKTISSLNVCTINKNYLIKPSIVVFQDPFISVKKNIMNGSIISLPINTSVEIELPIIINYINSKGYEMVTLEKLIDENIVKK